MARYQIILAYDGTGFYGSQRQGRTRTVQSELEKALGKIGWTGKSVLLAGRTDTGVHASGQVAAFDLDWGHGLDDLHKALNASLPSDMAVRRVDLVPVSFHPRFQARSRRYRYRLFCQEVRDPLRERYAWRVWPPVADLKPLAVLWPGAHDFAAFGSPTTPQGSTVRTVESAEWRLHGDEWTFEIEADAFLYRMVRRLVYVQVAAGQGRAASEDLARALDGRPPVREAAKRRIPAGLALPSGLTLVEVKYDNLA
ncbi:MAG: tRNA pseudouridine(38-40) synthase TruA [Chloroflexota bacterium]